MERKPEEEKADWEKKKSFIAWLDAYGDEALEKEREAAHTLNDKIKVMLKTWVFRVLGFLIAPFGWAIMWGLEKIALIAEADYIPASKELLEDLRDNPDLPPSIKKVLDRACGTRSFAWSAFLIGVLIAIIITTLISTLAPYISKLSQGVMGTARSELLPDSMAIAAYLRDPAFETRMRDIFSKRGYPEDDIDHLILAMQTLLAATPLTNYYLRFVGGGGNVEVVPEGYLDDMRKLGFDNDEARRFWATAHFYPSPIDLITWQAKEVFEPEMITRYGLDSEFGTIDTDPFHKAGMTDEQILNYWRAHWEHASYMQIRDMVHRGVLSKTGAMPAPPTTKEGWAARDAEALEAAYDWYRLVEIPPFWRERLTEMMFEVPTRVDVRRWWDMQTIDEERMRSLYHAQGYHGDDLEDYILWTKVYVAFPDLLARFKNGWITEDEVRTTLIGLGMPADRVEEMIQTRIKAAAPERLTEERDLTKTDIVMWVKEEPTARWNQGIALLEDLGYDSTEADMILSARVELASSPETFDDYRKITEKWRQAVGAGPRELTENLKRKAEELVKAKDQVAVLKESLRQEEATLIDEEVLPEEATERRDQLRIALHRSEAELFRIQGEYDALRAEWQQLAR